MGTAPVYISRFQEVLTVGDTLTYEITDLDDRAITSLAFANRWFPFVKQVEALPELVVLEKAELRLRGRRKKVSHHQANQRRSFRPVKIVHPSTRPDSSVQCQFTQSDSQRQMIMSPLIVRTCHTSLRGLDELCHGALR